MITFAKIKKAVNDKLKETFNIPVNSNDIKEGFKRPSFFIEFDEPKVEGLLTQVEKSTIIRIYYFPTNQNESSIEIIGMMDLLPNAFDMKLTVEDRQLDIFEPNFTISDGVLQFEFDLMFQDGRYEDESAELMQELDIDIQKG